MPSIVRIVACSCSNRSGFSSTRRRRTRTCSSSIRCSAPQAVRGDPFAARSVRRTLIFHRLQLREIELRHGGLQLVEAEAAPARADDESIAEDDRVFVGTARFRDLLVHEPAVDALRALGAVFVFVLAL